MVTNVTKFTCLAIFLLFYKNNNCWSTFQLYYYYEWNALVKHKVKVTFRSSNHNLTLKKARNTHSHKTMAGGWGLLIFTIPPSTVSLLNAPDILYSPCHKLQSSGVTSCCCLPSRNMLVPPEIKSERKFILKIGKWMCVSFYFGYLRINRVSKILFTNYKSYYLLFNYVYT